VKWGGPSGVFLVRKQLKWAAVIIALIFIGLQFTTPSHTNPPFDEAQTLQGITNVPPDISALLPGRATTATATRRTGGGTPMSLLSRG
jgi:hypothetical protein